MGRIGGWIVGAWLAAAGTPAIAQAASPIAFSGAYAGAEIGLHEHHIFLRITDLGTGETRSRYYRGWGIGGGAFAGYDLAVARRIRVGIEAGGSFGGTGPKAVFPDGTVYRQTPRYGLSAAGRAGYLIGDRLLVYGTLGYGGYVYRLGGNAHVRNARASGSSFTIGSGVEYRLSSRVGIRLDFRHLDNQMSHLLIGVPVRF